MIEGLISVAIGSMVLGFLIGFAWRGAALKRLRALNETNVETICIQAAMLAAQPERALGDCDSDTITLPNILAAKSYDS